MKNYLFIVLLGLTVCSAPAAVILYSQDFSTNPQISPQDQVGHIPLGVINGEYDYQNWVRFSTTYNGGTDDLTLRTSGNNPFNDASRGAGFALDGTGFFAGDYSLTFDVISANLEGVGVGIYAMDFGGTHAYAIDTVSGPEGWLFVNPRDPSNVRTTLSADQMITGTGTNTINFTVGPGNAGHDLIFLFTARSTSGIQRSTTIDNVVVSTTAVPEPSTVALLGIGLFSMIFLQRGRRRKHAEGM